MATAIFLILGNYILFTLLGICVTAFQMQNNSFPQSIYSVFALLHLDSNCKNQVTNYQVNAEKNGKSLY